MYDFIIVGAGAAGCTAARVLAENGKKKVLLLEQRSHVGGNCFDEKDEYGMLIHKYGPHIFHTNKERVYEFLSRFTKWIPYEHKVAANVYGTMIPVPFNFHTMEIVYGKEKAERMRKRLIAQYGIERKVPILQLVEDEDAEIREIAKFVYEKIYLYYTQKQWGLKPEELDSSVTGRVPVHLSWDDRYFQDRWQGIPKEGYTKMFESMLHDSGVEVRLNTKAQSVFTVKEDCIFFDGERFLGKVIYTGPLDELFDCCYGRLPYRSLQFKFEHLKTSFYQNYGVVNYTVDEEYTRITEYKWMTGQQSEPETTIAREYPMPYSGKKDEIPYYAIVNEENMALYERYKKLAKRIPGFYCLGRLAEYQYYNIDGIVERSLELADDILKKEMSNDVL